MNENGKMSPIFSIFLRNSLKFSDILHFSPKFSEILRFSPEMTAKTTENDRENGSSGKKLWNEFHRNSTIFHSFSSIFHLFSSIFRENSVYLHRFNEILDIKVWKEKSI